MRPLIGQCLAGIAKACEAAGEVAAAADYSEQALIAPHQARVADNVGSEDRCQFALLTGQWNFLG
jgi:hypothetical protein